MTDLDLHVAQAIDDLKDMCCVPNWREIEALQREALAAEADRKNNPQRYEDACAAVRAAMTR